VTSRARRSTKRLASVADSVNCQAGIPNRLRNCSPAATPSSLGSIVVRPRAASRAIAATVAAGACPVIAPVSPRQKSVYSIPSTSISLAPSASETQIGKSPGQRVIQFIGTPDSSGPPACSPSSRERGCSLLKRVRSRSIRAQTRVGSIVIRPSSSE